MKFYHTVCWYNFYYISQQYLKSGKILVAKAVSEFLICMGLTMVSNGIYSTEFLPCMGQTMECNDIFSAKFLPAVWNMAMDQSDKMNDEEQKSSLDLNP